MSRPSSLRCVRPRLNVQPAPVNKVNRYTGDTAGRACQRKTPYAGRRSFTVLLSAMSRMPAHRQIVRRSVPSSNVQGEHVGKKNGGEGTARAPCRLPSRTWKNQRQRRIPRWELKPERITASAGTRVCNAAHAPKGYGGALERYSRLNRRKSPTAFLPCAKANKEEVGSCAWRRCR
jgi:hypothetical protein